MVSHSPISLLSLLPDGSTVDSNALWHKFPHSLINTRLGLLAGEDAANLWGFCGCPLGRNIVLQSRSYRVCAWGGNVGTGATVQLPPPPTTDLPQCRARGEGMASVHWLLNPLIIALPPRKYGGYEYSSSVLRITLLHMELCGWSTALFTSSPTQVSLHH